MEGLVILVLGVIAHFTASSTGYIYNERARKCERITIPMCQDMPYNMTRMPNYLGNYDQAEANLEITQYAPLVEYGCSKHLRFFLCSVFAPMCTEQVDLSIPSCQSICEEVRDSCTPVLMKFSFLWPATLNCSKFPSPEKNGLCMQFPNTTEERSRSAPVDPFDSNRFPYKNHMNDYMVDRGLTPSCPPKFVYVGEIRSESSKFVYVGETNKSKYACAPKCSADVYYRHDDKEWTQSWMAVWAWICFASTLFTLLTCCLEMDRFKYPERPVILQSLCYNIVSLAYVVRFFMGPEAVSCSQIDSDDAFVIFDGMDNSVCVILFLLQYYFGLAACLWWVMLTVTWYLSAAKKWSNEALSKFSSWFHVVSWGIPAVQTIIILTLRKIDGDELTGMCYVGNSDDASLMAFIIVPLSVFLVIGTMFMFLGIAAMVRIRQVMRVEGRNSDKFDNLMMKIGVFSIAYLIPALAVVGCHVYEYENRSVWDAKAKSKAVECYKNQSSGLLKKTGRSECELEQSIPSLEVFAIKIFMSLVVGVTSSLWVWSKKTWYIWKKFIRSIFCCSSPSPKSPAVMNVPLQTVDAKVAQKVLEERRPRRPRGTSRYRDFPPRPEHIAQMQTLVSHV